MNTNMNVDDMKKFVDGGLVVKPVESDNYGFISFSHRDQNYVKKIIYGLCQRGHRLWWDEGIALGAAWYDTIAQKIKGCSYGIIVLTENYVQSNNCIDELFYIHHNATHQAVRPFIVQIGDVDIPEGIDLRLSRDQVIQCADGETETVVDKLDFILNKKQRMKELSTAAEGYWANGAYYDACSCYLAMLEVAEEKEFPEIYLNLGTVFQTEGDYKHAIAHFEKGVQVCQQLNLLGATLVTLLEHLGTSYANLHDVEKATQYFERANNLAESNSMPSRWEYYETAIASIKNTIGGQPPIPPKNAELLQKIAAFQQSSSDLMQEILKSDLSPEAYNCIRTNLMRLINYCRIVGGLDSIITQCNSDLKKSDEEYSSRRSAKKDYSPATKEVTAFRNFLGLEKPGAPDYDVFISYKSEDQKLAERICNRIRMNGKHVFLATNELKEIGNCEYVEMIDDALNHSKHLIVVATNTDYLSTGWVKHEWQWFESRRRDGEKEGEILLVFDDQICDKKNAFPPTLMDKEIFPTSCYEERIFNYLW